MAGKKIQLNFWKSSKRLAQEPIAALMLQSSNQLVGERSCINSSVKEAIYVACLINRSEEFIKLS
jgi:hypothetical protein